MTLGSRGDYPLPDAPDPLHYVPLPEHERALAALQDALACGMTRIALLGPPGFGKTLLLRRLNAERLPSSRVFYVPFLTVGAGELTAWLLSWMGAQAGALSDDEFVTWARVEQRLGRRCVLLLDEAQLFSIETARRIDEWVARAGGALQVVVSGIEGSAFEQVLHAFDPSMHRVGLRRPLRGEALRGFAHALVERTLGVRGDAPTWVWEEEELYEKTSGVPRLVKAELRARLERMPASAPPESRAIAAAQQVALPPSPSALPPAACDTEKASFTPAVRAPEAARPRSVRTLPNMEAAQGARSRALAAVCLLLLLGVLMMPSARQSIVSASPPPVVSTAAEEVRVSVHINADPWARIRIDGRPVGVTPLAGLRVTRGEHEVIATFPDGRELIKRIVAEEPGASVFFP